MDKSFIIITRSGTPVNPYRLEEEMIRIDDIAHALSRLCRYNGHTEAHYSVAQHSIHVAQYLGHVKFDDRLVFAALLHDAPEAYLGDMIRPVKRGMREYTELENEIRERIWRWAGLFPDREARQYISAVDAAIIANEVQAFFTEKARRNWPLTYAGLPLHFRLKAWPAEVARRRFLELYHSLKKSILSEAIRERHY